MDIVDLRAEYKSLYMWGITDGLFIDGKTYKDMRPERIEAVIARRVETLRTRRKESKA